MAYHDGHVRTQKKGENPQVSMSNQPISFLCNSSLADADKRC
jgi:hypothetical protein